MSALTSRSGIALIVTLVVLFLLVLIPATTAQEEQPVDANPRPGAIGAPSAPLASKHVYDNANLLNDAQEASIEADATRLARFDLPTLILVQLIELPPSDAEAFAAEVRRQWGIETAPGTDDGLVILVSINPAEDSGMLTTLSWGENALPQYGVDAPLAEQLQAEWLDSRVSDGQLYEGILFTLRKLIYHSIYDPAPQAPLSTMQRITNAVIDVVGPAMAIVGAAITSAWWRGPGGLRGTAGALLVWGVPLASLGLAIVSIWSRSGWGATSALVLLALTAAIWVRRDPARARTAQIRGQSHYGRTVAP